MLFFGIIQLVNEGVSAIPRVQSSRQMEGSASMQPTGSDHESTLLSVSISNATPGGVHPWQVRRGQCGADQGAFNSGARYQPVKVGDDGRGEAGLTVPGTTPEAGEFFVTVY